MQVEELLQQTQIAVEMEELQNVKTESLQKHRLYLEKANFELKRNLSIQKRTFSIDHSNQEHALHMHSKAAVNTAKLLEAKGKLIRSLENQIDEMDWSMRRRLEQLRERLAGAEDRIDYQKRESAQLQNDLNQRDLRIASLSNQLERVYGLLAAKHTVTKLISYLLVEETQRNYENEMRLSACRQCPDCESRRDMNAKIFTLNSKLLRRKMRGRSLSPSQWLGRS